MTMLDAQHWFRSIYVISDDNHTNRAAEQLCKHYAFRADGQPVSETQAKKGKIAIISMTIKRRKATFTDTTKSLLSYMQAFSKILCRISRGRAHNRRRGRPGFLTFLASNARGTHIRYITVDKITTKHHGMLLWLEMLNEGKEF